MCERNIRMQIYEILNRIVTNLEKWNQSPVMNVWFSMFLRMLRNRRCRFCSHFDWITHYVAVWKLTNFCSLVFAFYVYRLMLKLFKMFCENYLLPVCKDLAIQSLNLEWLLILLSYICIRFSFSTGLDGDQPGSAHVKGVHSPVGSLMHWP